MNTVTYNSRNRRLNHSSPEVLFFFALELRPCGVYAVCAVVVADWDLQLPRAVRAVLAREALTHACVVVANALLRTVHLAKVARLAYHAAAVARYAAVRLIRQSARVVS